jgi:hypothetical protein
MGLDYAFWKSGEGSHDEIYADLGEGRSGRLVQSEDVWDFRGRLLEFWPELRESIEPWEEDPKFDPADLSKYVVINIHASDVNKMAAVWEIAERCHLVAYDPLHRHS